MSVIFWLPVSHPCTRVDLGAKDDLISWRHPGMHLIISGTAIHFTIPVNSVLRSNLLEVERTIGEWNADSSSDRGTMVSSTDSQPNLYAYVSRRIVRCKKLIQ